MLRSEQSPHCRPILGLALALLLAGVPYLTATADRGHRSRCGGILDEIVITADDQTETVVTLDDIVPEDLQGMIRTDRKALTGVWISDLDLWTNVNAAACEIPKAADCPENALEGACPDVVPGRDNVTVYGFQPESTHGVEDALGPIHGLTSDSS